MLCLYSYSDSSLNTEVSLEEPEVDAPKTEKKERKRIEMKEIDGNFFISLS